MAQLLLNIPEWLGAPFSGLLHERGVQVAICLEHGFGCRWKEDSSDQHESLSPFLTPLEGRSMIDHVTGPWITLTEVGHWRDTHSQMQSFIRTQVHRRLGRGRQGPRNTRRPCLNLSTGPHPRRQPASGAGAS